jgi:RNA polymerase sigma factor (sigma-70 family)
VALQLRATPLRRLVDRERLVAEYFYLCRRAAGRFMRRGLDRADLEQVGAIGLIKAVDRYDSSFRTPFEAYAWLLIVGELMHFARDGDLVRAPRRLRELERRWQGAERELQTLLGGEPPEQEVAARVGATPAQIRELRAYRASKNVLSIESFGYCDDPVSACSIDDLIDWLSVEGMLRALSPLERQIVIAIHLHGSTIVDLAARLGYSRRHVTRLHRAAMQRLKRSTGVGALRSGEGRRGVSLSYRR